MRHLLLHKLGVIKFYYGMTLLGEHHATWFLARTRTKVMVFHLITFTNGDTTTIYKSINSVAEFKKNLNKRKVQVVNGCDHTENLYEYFFLQDVDWASFLHDTEHEYAFECIEAFRDPRLTCAPGKETCAPAFGKETESKILPEYDFHMMGIHLQTDLE